MKYFTEDLEIDLHKRYWLFNTPAYYPSGGLYDIEQTFNHLSNIHDYYDSKVYKQDYDMFDSKAMRFIKPNNNKETS